MVVRANQPSPDIALEQAAVMRSHLASHCVALRCIALHCNVIVQQSIELDTSNSLHNCCDCMGLKHWGIDTIALY